MSDSANARKRNCFVQLYSAAGKSTRSPSAEAGAKIIILFPDARAAVEARVNRQRTPGSGYVADGFGAPGGSKGRAYEYPCGEREFGKETGPRYLYPDAEGHAYVQKRKYEFTREDGSTGKSYPIYHHVNRDGYDSTGSSNWEKGSPDGPQIPYNLPELLEAKKDALFVICEGEKDCDSLVDLGVAYVTTNWGGAVFTDKDGTVKNWPPELDPYFADHPLLFCEDNDRAGKRHVQNVARQLKPRAPSIKVIHFREFAERFDVTDWLEMRAEKLFGDSRSWRTHEEYRAILREELMARAVDWIDEDTPLSDSEIEALLSESATNPGAPFEPETARRLAWLKIDHPAKYESLRAKFKASKMVRVSELDKLIAREIAKIQGHEKDDRTQVDILLQLAHEATFFHTADGVGYADVRIDEHRETWAIGSKGFKRWLTRRYHQETERAPSSEAFQATINVLEAEAQFDAPEMKIHVRNGGFHGKIYIDVCDAKWRAIEIDAEGWRIIDEPPIRFRRSAGMEALPIPRRGGSVENLKKYLNVKTDEDFILAVAFLLMAMKDDGPYVILALLGEQGTAKSTFATILRRLADPNVAALRTLPRDDRDLAIAAKNSYVQAFDNVSCIPPWLSDAFCRLATGSGFATRQLYTDDEEALFDARRPILLNGIDGFITRPDLSDRCVTLTLEKIGEDKRRSENKLMAEFEKEAPGILGALLDVVAHGLRELPNVKPEELPRMADFFVWLTACEGALWASGSFARAYEQDRDDLALKNVEADNVALAIRTFINDAKVTHIWGETQKGIRTWSGTTEELLTALNFVAHHETRAHKTWPATPRALSSRLARIIPPLRKTGIEIEIVTDSHTKRATIKITTEADIGAQATSAAAE